MNPTDSTIVLIAALTCWNCGGLEATNNIQPVRRDVSVSSERILDPLRLDIQITNAGVIRLNEIDIGTKDDIRPLAEKVRIVFADRQHAGIRERGISIRTAVRTDLSKLLDELRSAGADPIRIIYLEE